MQGNSPPLPPSQIFHKQVLSIITSMSAKAPRYRGVIRSEARRKLERVAAKSQASQPKVAIRASSRLKKKEIIRNRSLFFPGTTPSSHLLAISRRYLPDDVVINIFNIYLRMMQTSHLDKYDWPGLRATPFFLASICFSWSRIIRSTPYLWKHLDLHLEPKRYKHQCSLLRQWLGHTSGCNISVSVLTHLHDQLYWDAHLPRQIYDIVESRASQITDLSIPVFPDFCAEKMTGFQNLRHLRVDCGQHLFPRSDTLGPALEIEAPSLVRLQTYAVDTNLINIVDDQGNTAPLQGLQALSTQIVTAHLTYDTLRLRQLQQIPRMSALTHLDISSLENEPMPAHALANDAPRLQFPHLVYLRCNSFVHIGAQIGFAPLLATLVCYIPTVGNPEPEHISEAIDFLSNARCSRLEAFIVSSPDQLFNVNEDDLLALLWMNPELRDVSIMGAAYDEDEQEQYLSDALIRALCVIAPPTLDQESNAPRDLLVPRLRSFTYCGPTNPRNFTSLNVWRMLQTRFELHSTIHTTPCPLDVFRIISTNPISDYDDESKGTYDLIPCLHEEFPHLTANVMEGIGKNEMYDAEMMSGETMSPELRYLSYCDHPHGVGPDEPFDRDFFQLRFIMGLDERLTRRYGAFA